MKRKENEKQLAQEKPFFRQLQKLCLMYNQVTHIAEFVPALKEWRFIKSTLCLKNISFSQ